MRNHGVLAALLLGVASIAGCGSSDDSAADAATTSPDAGVRDAGGPCETDVDCDDGLFCNGVERCVESVCVPGTPPVCDDGIACTRDYCSEDRASCVHQVPDEDGDGFGAATCVDDEGVPLGTDCDDHDANRFPGNREVCDPEGHDEDCDPTTHGGLDADGDGFESAQCCNVLPDGTRSCGDDCDDGRRQVNPSGTEVCDGIDDDCDGTIDEGVQVLTYADADRDGEGDPATAMMACAGVAGRVANGTDCDDTRPDRRSGQPELCDGVDNDCDGRVDEMAGPVTWYRDADGDGFGTTAEVMTSCTPVPGWSLLGTDCDDTRASINPAAAELCDGIDNDCSGRADFQIAPGDYEDDDGDGYVDVQCGGPLAVDCHDNDPNAGPGEPETCDGRDNDCDGRVDEDVLSYAWFRDADGDGYGATAGAVVVSCGPVAGFVRRGGDCDDTDRTRNPAAREVCSGRDDDCDGAVDESPASDMCDDDLGQVHACIAGRCRPVACVEGLGDCDGRPDTGCEVDLLTDPEHCGGCGLRCGGLPGTTAGCVDGVCEPPACAPGYLDCDGDLGLEDSNGCEVAGSTCPPVVASFTWGTPESDDPPYPGSIEVAALSDGSSYVAANYYGSLQVGEASYGGPGEAAALLRFDAHQRLLWSRSLRPSEDGVVTVTRVLVDDGTGDVFVLGFRRGGPATFDGQLLGSTGFTRAGFVARITPSGALVWSQSFDSEDEVEAYGLARDGAGDLVVVGLLAGDVWFDSTVLSTSGDEDVFVARVSASDGSVLAAFQLGTSNAHERAFGVAVLPGGDYVLVGAVFGFDTDFGGAPFNAYGSEGADGFWARVTPTGTGVFAGGAADWLDEFFFDVHVGPTTGDFYVSGFIDFQTTIGGIAITASMPGAVLARVSATTGVAEWAIASDGSGSANDGMRRFTIDSLEVIRGVLPMSAPSGGTFGNATLPTPEDWTASYLPVVDADGWVSHVEPLSSSEGNLTLTSVAWAGGRTLAAGYFDGDGTFGGHRLTSKGGSDQVLLRFRDL